ncbi:hypothetical protein ACFXKX_03320 [Streptomyces scopuliridis]|uniref:hypothetical protein n=1 Tax=Streptomyces scopuliridis TaxID=452529 RepID=UPI0036C1C184
MTQPLDLLTVARIARLIVDIDGPFERRGYQLAQLLERAAWPQPEEYDGTPRVTWLSDVVTGMVKDHAAISRLLCRLCDPLEYDDGLASAEIVRQELNQILTAEQVAVTYVAGRPVLGELAADGHSIFTAPDDLEARIRPLVSSDAFLQQLMQRVAETRICEQHGAYGLALIGIGSFTEALLLDVLTYRDSELLQGIPLPTGTKRVAPERASFALLLDTARARGWIQMDAHDFMTIVREYRNFVHLRAQQDRGVVPDQDTVRLCWGPVLAVLNDLETSNQ